VKHIRTIERACADLRRIVEDGSRDDYETRIAYAMESALRWAAGKAGDYYVVDDALLLAKFLRQETANHSEAVTDG
jgi:hypothetical protein